MSHTALFPSRDFEYWEEKDNFAEGFQKYYAQHPKEPNMLPETFLLDTKQRRKAFQARLEEQGGYDEPWVLKIPDKNNGEGITIMGPNSEELEGVFDTVQKHLQKQEEDKKKSRMVVQSYICNELTWYRSHKFDLRFYFMVASIDPLIVLYHDGTSCLLDLCLAGFACSCGPCLAASYTYIVHSFIHSFHNHTQAMSEWAIAPMMRVIGPQHDNT